MNEDKFFPGFLDGRLSGDISLNLILFKLFTSWRHGVNRSLGAPSLWWGRTRATHDLAPVFLFRSKGNSSRANIRNRKQYNPSMCCPRKRKENALPKKRSISEGLVYWYNLLLRAASYKLPLPKPFPWHKFQYHSARSRSLWAFYEPLLRVNGYIKPIA